MNPAFYTLCHQVNFNEFSKSWSPHQEPLIKVEGDPAVNYPLNSSYRLIPEQHALAVFLDRKTARIDQLITKHESANRTPRGIPRTLSSPKLSPRDYHANAVYAAGLEPEHLHLKPSGIEWIGATCLCTGQIKKR